MPESAEEVYARVVAQVGVDGHLPMPPYGDWDVFPWEGENLRPRIVQPPSFEPPRQGEDAATCGCTGEPHANAIWTDDVWEVRPPSGPSGLPLMLFICPLEHLDYEDLTEEMAASLGVLQVRLSKIISAMPNIGRVHVMKVGDGAVHLHVWVMARTARMTHVLGSPAIEWDEILPPVPEDVWRANLRAVATALAATSGRALV